jgi:hypothetical protein
LATLTTTMGVITRAHGCSTHGWTNAHMPFTASFPEFDIAVIQVADLTNGGITSLADQTNFTGGHTDLGKISLLG